MTHNHTPKTTRDIFGAMLHECSCGARKWSNDRAIDGATLDIDGWYVPTEEYNITHATEIEKSTRLYAYSNLYGNYGVNPGRIVIEFDEAGWQIVEDTRANGATNGYLHVGDEGDISAYVITDAVRDNIIRYMYSDNKPALGATPQGRYFRGLSIKDLERIGNGGKRAFYA